MTAPDKMLVVTICIELVISMISFFLVLGALYMYAVKTIQLMRNAPPINYEFLFRGYTPRNAVSDPSVLGTLHQLIIRLSLI